MLNRNMSHKQNPKYKMRLCDTRIIVIRKRKPLVEGSYIMRKALLKFDQKPGSNETK